MWDICGREQRRWRGADGEESVLHTCGRYRVPGTQERTLNSGESSVWCCGVCAPGVEVAWCAAGRRGETSLFFNSKLHNPVLRRSGKPPLLLDSHACALPVSTPPPTVSHTHTSPQPHTPALSPALLPYVKALHTHTNAKYTHSREHAQLSSLSLSPPQHTHVLLHTLLRDIKLQPAIPIIIG